MLDHVERRAFLVQPARKDPLPTPPRLLDVELDEGAGQLLILPRGTHVARAQAHHGIAKADRLAGLERDVAHDPVALVEQPEHRDPVRHRSHPGHRLDRLGNVDGHGVGAIDGLTSILSGLAAPCEDQQDGGAGDQARQDYSGFHA
jgi:hypothetical protein